MIKQTANELISYIKNPNPFIKKEADKIFNNQLFPLVLICLLFAFASSYLIEFLVQLNWIKPLPEFKLFDIKEKKIYLFFMVVFGAPIIEETIFRYQLKNWYLAFLGWAVLIAILIRFVTPAHPYIGVVIALVMIIIPFYFKKAKLERLKFIAKFFKYHFYITALIFGLSHIHNYNQPFQYGWGILLLVLPQLFIGIVLGYVRMRFGLKNAIILHAAYNFIPALSLLAGYKL
jgi:hypothetical protein